VAEHVGQKHCGSRARPETVCGVHKPSIGVSFATQYKKTPEDVGDLWYFLAALAKKLVTESQDASYGHLSHLATKMIQ
jgi:hypothetical protein